MKFEVENFKSSYHAILRTPALANFLAVPHYVYLQLKMPGKIGVLSLHDDVKKSYDCDQMVIKYTSTTRMLSISKEILSAAQQLAQS